MNYVVFFSFKINKETVESMAIVKAFNNIEVREKFKCLVSERKYEDLHVWWAEELDKMYGENEIIIH